LILDRSGLLIRLIEPTWG